MTERDRYFMRKALRLAGKGEGRTSPNPMVGAVVVRNGEIVGQGYHARVGGPHAEVNALRDAGEKARGAVLYVTLEPCNHQGRTPPCTRAVLEAGISVVKVGMADPNPGVKGGGAEFLRSQGIEVQSSILERECRLLNQPFIKHSTTGLPYVTLKAAATLDGRIATRAGDARWISNEKSRRFVHRLRCALDGILVGIGTVLADDPMLTARPVGKPACRQPVRIVLDSRLRIPLSGQLVRSAREIPVWIGCGADAPGEKIAALTDAGAEILHLPETEGRLDLHELLKELGRRGITSLLVEGGGQVLGNFIDERLADDFYFFYAPKVIGDSGSVPMIQGRAAGREQMSGATAVHDVRVRRFGEDVMLSGRFRKEPY